jgi:phage FluMu protein Com
MIEIRCPWCEEPVLVELSESVQQSCPECLTSWSFEETAAEEPIAMAA